MEGGPGLTLLSRPASAEVRPPGEWMEQCPAIAALYLGRGADRIAGTDVVVAVNSKLSVGSVAAWRKTAAHRCPGW